MSRLFWLSLSIGPFLFSPPAFAHFITVQCALLFPSRVAPPYTHLPGGGVFSDFSTVAEEHQVSTRGRTVRLRFSGDRLAEGLVQRFSAPIALLGYVETLSTDVIEFGGWELHVPPLSRSFFLLG